MPDTYAESTDGLLLIANGIDPVRRWDGYTPTFETAGLPVPTVAPVAVVTGDGPVVGRYVVYFAWVDANGNESSFSPPSGEIFAARGSAVTETHTEVPPARATGYRFYRTTDGERGVAYLDFEGSGTPDVQTYVSAKSDADLQASEARAILDNRFNFLAGFQGPPPDDRPLVIWHSQRMFLAGVEPYAEGSVQVAAGSLAVTGIGTRWPSNWAGRFLHVPNAPKPVEIASVDVVAQTITLAEVWTGRTDRFSAYSIRPAPATEDLVYFSEASQPEYWSALHAFSIPQDGEYPTALYNLNSFLFIAKRRQTYRFTVQTDPATDGFVYKAMDRGAINHRCVVPVDGGTIILDDRGIYSFAGAGETTHLSDPIQNLFRDAGGINWQAGKFFHGVNSPTEDTVRFFVCLRGDYLPRHALAFNYRSGRWWAEEYPFPVGASALGWVGRVTGSWRRGAERVYLAGPGGRLYALGGLPTDGTATGGGEPLAVVSSTPCRVTLAGALTADAGIVGSGLAVSDGRGAGQTRMIVALSGTDVTVDRPFRITPDSTSKVILGGINYKLRTKRSRWGNGEVEQDRAVELWHEMRPGHVAAIAAFFDLRGANNSPFAQAARDANGVRTDADAKERVIDLGKPQGFSHLRMNAHREGGTDGDRAVAVVVTGASGQKPHVFNALTIRGAS